MIRFLPCGILLLTGWLLWSCSSQSNSVTSKGYHNLTAHYNGYYYAVEELTKIESIIQQNNKDDYNRILRLFPTFDSSMAKSFSKETEEAIKMASIAIQRHPNSKWVDDAYIVIGKVRMYNVDWGNAIQTFKYVNTKSKEPDARHLAIISLVRTFTEHQEYQNAQAAIDFLLKENLNNENKKKLLLEKAYYHQVQFDYDNMVRSLTAADPLLTRKDKRGRIYFIIGQVYQKLGFESEAFNYYKKCLGTNPDYEIDFYARLYMAQVAEISKNKNINAARKSFRRLLKDRKNKEFKDKIYYEMGLFEMKQKNVQAAIENLHFAVRAGSNKRIDGEAYLKLGEIYYDTLKKYELSHAYYDSAIGSLPPDYENYEQIKKRQEILTEFVKQLNTIQWQDSLLRMATLDSAALRKHIDSAYQIKKKQEELAQKKKRKSERITIETSASIFDTGQETTETGNWYFSNPSAIALGQTEFRRIWGDRILEDNWRRSARISPVDNTAASQPVADTTAIAAGQAQHVKEIDPVTAEFMKISQQIPRTEEQRRQAYEKIEDAYFKLGDIYYFQLEEKDNAVATYERLLQRFPASEYKPEVLYKLYLIFKDATPAKADQYATKLKQEFPNSTYTKILLNPNYIAESGQIAEKQKEVYKEAYDIFQQGDYAAASDTLRKAHDMGQTSFSPNLELLGILIEGKMGDVSRYQYLLQEFEKKYPDSELIPYVQNLLKASQDLQTSLEKSRGIRYIPSLQESHYFVMVLKANETLDVAASAQLESFHVENFPDLNLRTSNLAVGEAYTVVMVSDLPNLKASKEYYRTFVDKLPSLSEIQKYKFNKFVITKENFNIFYRTKGLDEYLRFFKKNYQEENQ